MSNNTYMIVYSENRPAPLLRSQNLQNNKKTLRREKQKNRPDDNITKCFNHATTCNSSSNEKTVSQNIDNAKLCLKHVGDGTFQIAHYKYCPCWNLSRCQLVTKAIRRWKYDATMKIHECVFETMEVRIPVFLRMWWILGLGFAFAYRLPFFLLVAQRPHTNDP